MTAIRRRPIAPLASALLLAALCSGSPAAELPRLNDSGQMRCVDENLDFTDQCSGTGQDAEFGRDATAANPADGRGGFSFVKIGADGRELPADAADWACVRDRVTGLVWEGKTRDGGPHDVARRFLNRQDGRPSDASTFVTQVNAEGWCGARDWRLPTRPELESLVDFSQLDGVPAIDTDWFPATATEYHWTSSSARPIGGGPDYFWAVGFFRGESIWYGGEFGSFAVRLVRAGRAAPAERWVLRAGLALDRATGLVWRRCSEGQYWSGNTCKGEPQVFLTSSDAVDRAREQAQASGLPWRLPNIKELSSLVDVRQRFPAMPRTPFPQFPLDARFHSATPWPDNPVFDWRVDVGEGTTLIDFWGGHVLLVRDAR